jgi:hypothetical protein
MILGQSQQPWRGTNPPSSGQKLHDLSAWLETATWALVPSAQARVRAEIEAHFAEAVQSHLANGLFASAAQAAAVADLGDPHAAAQRFRREHLTIGEAKAVGARLNAARRTGLLFYALLIVLLSSTLVSLLQITEWAFAPALDARFLFLPATILMLVLICAGLGLAADVLGHRQPTLATTRRIFLIWTIMGLIQQILTITILPATLIRVWLFRWLRNEYFGGFAEYRSHRPLKFPPTPEIGLRPRG